MAVAEIGGETMSANRRKASADHDGNGRKGSEVGETLLFDVPGPRGRRHIRIANVIGVILLVSLIIAVLHRLANPPQGQNQLSWELWRPALDWTAWRDFYLPGLWSTVSASFFAVLGALLFGVLFGMGRLSRHAVIRWFSSVVVEFCRAVPVLMFMIFLWRWFAFADLGGNVAFYAVVLALVLYNGSVIAELVRSGVVNLPHGQREAARSLGMGPLRSLLSVEVPQAILSMLPALISQIVIVLKDTALGYIITYTDLLQESRRLGSMYFNILQTLLVAAALYFVLCLCLTRFSQWLPRHIRVMSPAPVDE